MIQSRRLAPWMLIIALTALVIGLSLPNDTRADEDHSPLAELMETINSNYKQLRRAARTKRFSADTPKMLQEMQLATVKAMHEKVGTIHKLPADRQKAASIDFKKLMKKQLVTLIDMEIAYMEGRTDDVAEGVDDLGSIKSDGHDQFTED